MTHVRVPSARRSFLPGLVLTLAAAGPAGANGQVDGVQDDAATPPAAPESSWRFTLTPYLWIPAQDGVVGVRGARADVDLGVGDTFDAITDNFNFAAALHAEMQRDRLTLFADAMYLSLESEDNPSPAGLTDVKMDQGIFELGAAYALFRADRAQGRPGLAVEPLAGARIQTLSLDIDNAAGVGLSGRETWVDGFAGARARVELTDRISLRVRGDVGAGQSDLTWNALAGLDVVLCPHAVLQVGYRALDTDYSDGHGAERFEYDMLLHGPFLAVAIVF